MSEISIRITNLVKTYHLYDTPADRMKEALHPLRKQYHRQFYALNDINMDVYRGETVGIIGKNGAGKSTLLKIITGVLSPTSGHVETHGKIASLLELGAGFNPEMTGKENIYLNGTIMGYTRQEIDVKLPQIVEFADIGEFMYQPIKLYSSGMFARLAFAVAINVEPDILIIDEALSVGDAKFQRKCFAKFKELQEKNTTILFVSHDLEAIKAYTQRAYYFKEGRCVFTGKSDEAANRYLQDLFPPQEAGPSQIEPVKDTETDYRFCGEYTIYEAESAKVFGKGCAFFEKIVVRGLSGSNVFRGGENVMFDVHIRWIPHKVLGICQQENLRDNIIVGMYIEDVRYNKIFAFNTFLSDYYINPAVAEGHVVRFEIVMPKLAPGDYFLVPSIALGEHRVHTQLRWCDGFGMLRSIPERGIDFLGFIELPYVTKEGAG